MHSINLEVLFVRLQLGRVLSAAFRGFWTYCFLYIVTFNAYHSPVGEGGVVYTSPNIWIFDAFGEADLCLENIFILKVFINYFI